MIFALDHNPLAECGETSIAGLWRGSYRSDRPTAERGKDAFTAQFHFVPRVESNLYGEMNADSKTANSINSLIGSQTGSIIRFSQLSADDLGPASQPIPAMEFVGRISSDGTVMRGCWRTSTTAGTWIARRSQEPREEISQ